MALLEDGDGALKDGDLSRTIDAELARLDALLRSALGVLYWPTRRTVEALSAMRGAARDWAWILAGA